MSGLRRPMLALQESMPGLRCILRYVQVVHVNNLQSLPTHLSWYTLNFVP